MLNNTYFKPLYIITSLVLSSMVLSGCNLTSDESTVYCDDKPVGSEFIHNDMTYLVVDDETIRENDNLVKLRDGSLRFCSSHVTDMKGLFRAPTIFDMEKINWRARTFNHPIGDWDVSNVTDMTLMFSNTVYFNQPIGNWDVSNVTSMYGMFSGAVSFNHPLNQWDVSKVQDMSYMFDGASKFNQPLDNWNVSNVKSMEDMFYKANAFNQLLDNWAQKPKLPNITE